MLMSSLRARCYGGLRGATAITRNFGIHRRTRILRLHNRNRQQTSSVPGMLSCQMAASSKPEDISRAMSASKAPIHTRLLLIPGHGCLI
jgi:hypothetical protein